MNKNNEESEWFSNVNAFGLYQREEIKASRDDGRAIFVLAKESAGNGKFRSCGILQASPRDLTVMLGAIADQDETVRKAIVSVAMVIVQEDKKKRESKSK